MDSDAAIGDARDQGEIMVKRFLLLGISALFLLYGCPAGPPTGPDVDISCKLTMTSLLSSRDDTLYVYVSEWNKFSEHDRDFDYESIDNPYGDFWSVSGATVKIEVDGSSQLAEADTAKTPWQFYIHNWIYRYIVRSPEILPGQHWEISVTHPDYDSVFAETTIPDSVEFREFPQDTIRSDTGILRFSWNPADATEGYLPVLSFTAVRNDGMLYQREMLQEWNPEHRSGADTRSQENCEIQYALASIMDQARLSIKHKNDLYPNPDSCECFYFQMDVFSMDDGLYHIELSPYRPDELSSFSVPVQMFSNVHNGSGVLAAYQRSSTPRIIIDREFFIDYIKEE